MEWQYSPLVEEVSEFLYWFHIVFMIYLFAVHSHGNTSLWCAVCKQSV